MRTANACVKWLFESPVFQTIHLPNEGPDPFFKAPPRVVERKPVRRKLFSFRKFKAIVQRMRNKFAG